MTDSILNLHDPVIKEMFSQAKHQATTDSQVLDIYKALGCFQAYQLHYRRDKYTPLAVEIPYEFPLTDIKNDCEVEGPRRTHTGIKDAIVQDDRKRAYVMDHKIISSSVMGPTYLEALKLEPQARTYAVAAAQSGLNIEGVIWDIVVKPSIKPCKIQGKGIKKQILADLETGMYCGYPYPFTDWEGQDTETPKMYAQRVFATMTENAHKYFVRRHLSFTDAMIMEHAQTMVNLRNRMNSIQSYEDAIPNMHECSKYNSLCPYWSICTGADPERIEYQTRESDGASPFDKDCDGISPSSYKEFQRCERKWYLRKVERIEPRRAEYSDALHIGSLCHKAIEQWYVSKMMNDPITLVGNLAKTGHCELEEDEDGNDAE